MSADTEMIKDFQEGYSIYLSFNVCEAFIEWFIYQNRDLQNDYLYWGLDTLTREKAIDRLVKFLVPSVDHWPQNDDKWNQDDLSKLCQRMENNYTIWEDRLNVQSQR